MRHRKKGNHLGRTASHKKALMRNLAAQVFEHKEIRTTVAKAKELRSYVERLITYGKKRYRAPQTFGFPIFAEQTGGKYPI